MTTESTDGIRKSNRRWQSDVIVDLVKRYGFPYVALSPEASPYPASRSRCGG